MSVSNADRRTIIGAGALIAGVGLVASAASAQAADGGAWAPASEDKDAWMDIPGTRHRMVYDTTSASAFSEALFFANNYYNANKSGYGLDPDALGVIIIARHMSTPYAYTDAAWAKYGAGFAKMMQLDDDQAKVATKGNPMLPAKPDAGMMAGATVSELGAKGTRFAVCGLATQVIAGMVAKDAGQTADEAEAFLKANLVPGGVLVPAGIVAVNRAQEHGYSFAYVA